MICMTESWMALASSSTGRVMLAARTLLARAVDEELALVPALMEVAEALFLEGGRATLGAVDLEVAAAGDVQAEGAGEFVGFGLLFRMGLLRGSMHGYTAPGSDLLESWG
jgi:hypothetical protein